LQPRRLMAMALSIIMVRCSFLLLNVYYIFIEFVMMMMNK
jgi:hypothetical protein